MYEPGQEIIRPAIVSNPPCHIEAIKGLTVIAVEEAATNADRSRSSAMIDLRLLL
jgi:hypothetical protein